MLNRIKDLFDATDTGEGSSGRTHDDGSLRAAAAALLVEAARSDEGIAEAERARILDIAKRRFDLNDAEAQDLLTDAVRETRGVSPLDRYVSVLMDRCPPERRVWIIETLWEVVYADGELNDIEANLLRRLGGLLHVSDIERGEARKRALARLGLPEDTGLPDIP
ncbi:TerB family tellurite resistance protein [Azospirillum sp. SYSU D00513]|uniref:tellurite resistance TerB family protein n=1 Tax=Azospirillum sp. SYSU D00513 TaxID=2812561 RepID=UPI001A976891|nr:TerB family tellurite resistance protein [Azospirillum sp. SYSU D00513]